MQPLMRRRFLTGAVMVTAGLSLLSACSAPAPAPAGKQAPAPQEAKTLRVMMNGGNYETTARKHVTEPFMQANNVKIEIIPALSAETLTRLRAERSAPTVDLVVWDDLVAVAGRADGLVEKIDPANIPNLKDLDPEADYKDGYGPAAHANVLLIAYNKELVKIDPPRSFKQLWDPKYKGQLSMASVNLTSGMLVVLQSSLMNGGSYENIDPGLEAMKRLQPNIAKYYNTIPEITTMLKAEPLIMLAGTNQVYPLITQGAPIEAIFPEEGCPAFPGVLDIVKGTKEKALAEKLLNAFLAPDAQVGFAKDSYFVVFNKKAPIPQDLKNRMPPKLIIYDPVKISRNREQWAARWKREIGG